MSIQPQIAISTGDLFFTEELPIHVNRASESFQLQRHAHDFIEICIVAEGSGEHYIDDTHFKVTKGDLFYIPIGMSHVFRPSSASANNRLVVYNCIFTKPFLDELTARQPLDSVITSFLNELEHDCRWLSLRDANGEAERIIERMHLEYTQRMVGYTSCLHTGLADLLVLVYRQNFPAPSIDNDSVNNSLRDWLSRIDHDVANTYRASDIAFDMGISVRQLQRLMRSTTGMPLTEYVQLARIKQSRRLLSETNQKISFIAAAVGYQDMKFFNRLFKQHSGMTPSDYRKLSTQ